MHSTSTEEETRLPVDVCCVLALAYANDLLIIPLDQGRLLQYVIWTQCELSIVRIRCEAKDETCART